MPFPKIKSHELASRFTARLSWQFDSDCFPMTIQKLITPPYAPPLVRLRMPLRYYRCYLLR
jgi:hypothetical protein